ncbi:hypothetical protein ACIRRA_44620 [Nocardia sp. NPDC101769]|uniref:hypothetical protein n=1 Tax=Nocardia sp. NPDC101769 TaxID=3364333 RepID=UPI00381F1D90
MFGYVFDDRLLTALGNGDHNSGALLASLHDRDIRVSVPVVTLAYAFTALPVERSAELLGIVVAMTNTAVEPLSDAVDALELAEFLAQVPDDPAAVHALVTARKQAMEIVTVDPERWRSVQARLSVRVPLVELTDES